MKEYLLLFRNSTGTDGYLTSSEDMASDMPLWQGWIGQIAMQGKLISTAPVEFTGSCTFKENVADGAYLENENVMVTGYLICKGDSLEEMQELSKSCPILKYPKSSVEIKPLIPFPTR